MTERERFEEIHTFDLEKDEDGEYIILETSACYDFFCAGWQAALKCGEPVAWAWMDKSNAIWEIEPVKVTGEHLGMMHKPLYTSPPNTYTEKEVDEMLIMCLEIAEDDLIHRDGVLIYDKESIIDMVKAEKG